MSAEVNVLSPHWREVATHAVAFTAAVIVLRKYAWKPILGLLEERRARIADEFRGIERGKRENLDLKTEYEQQLRTIDAQARQKLKESTDEGQKVSAELKEEARRESREMVQRAREEVEREKHKAEVALKEDMVEMAVAAAEKVIREKLDERAHRRLIAETIEDLTRLKTR
ncbi:MAG: F0F1 ATP synthase subunit B [Candidatus Eisenbacteria bacterium]|nr:F0F1 ATP synthase subunit B [Candidatus Latescibacterota bacterium]MBD3301494.1 F0F1 ATP synthase subunit B [Candidatus Eisenbacteria bacterium]